MTPEDLVLLVGRVDGKLDTLLERMPAMETRLNVLEKFNAKLIGIVIAVSAVFTATVELGFRAYAHLKGA